VTVCHPDRTWTIAMRAVVCAALAAYALSRVAFVSASRPGGTGPGDRGGSHVTPMTAGQAGPGKHREEPPREPRAAAGALPPGLLRELRDLRRDVASELAELDVGIGRAEERTAGIARAIGRLGGSADRGSELPVSEDAVKERIACAAVQNERIPLVLVHARSDQEEVGTPAIRRLFRRDGYGRFGDDVRKGGAGRACLVGTRANFSFWAPYPLWATDVVVRDESSASQFCAFTVVAYLDNEMVHESAVVTVRGPVTRVALGRPVRFRTLLIAAEGNFGGGKVCVGEVSALAAPGPAE